MGREYRAPGIKSSNNSSVRARADSILGRRDLPTAGVVDMLASGHANIRLPEQSGTGFHPCRVHRLFGCSVRQFLVVAAAGAAAGAGAVWAEAAAVLVSQADLLRLVFQYLSPHHSL